MKGYLFCLPLLFFVSRAVCQPVQNKTFLKSYEKYRLNQIAKVKPRKARKKLENFHKSQTVELDTIFQSYKAKTGFDFNTADTIYMIKNWALESPFISDIIIWSGQDTISYSQGYELIAPHKNKRTVTYVSFTFWPYEQVEGFKTITERDSLITLVSKRDFNTILHLGDNQSFMDGGRYSIYVAIKEKNKYTIEHCSPRQFWIKTIYRKK